MVLPYVGPQPELNNSISTNHTALAPSVAVPDFLNIVRIAVDKENLSGIYNLCEDSSLHLQEFLHRLACHWNYSKPWRIPS